MENIFNSKLICVKSGTVMAEARELMREKRIRHLPIVSEDNRITAVLTAHDITDVAKFQDMPVDLFASFPVKHVNPDAKLSDVALYMIKEKISCLIVAQDGKATGIITTDDLLYELSKLLKEKEKKSGSVMDNVLVTAGEFSRRLADIGI